MPRLDAGSGSVAAAVEVNLKACESTLRQSLETKYRSAGIQQVQRVSAAAATKIEIHSEREQDPLMPYMLNVPVKVTYRTDRKIAAPVEVDVTEPKEDTIAAVSDVITYGVFDTNEKLKEMVGNMPVAAGTIPFTEEEIKRSARETIDRDARNASMLLLIAIN